MLLALALVWPVMDEINGASQPASASRVTVVLRRCLNSSSVVRVHQYAANVKKTPQFIVWAVAEED